MDDPYATLGVEPSATQADIKRAYQRAAMRAHPDRHGGDDSEFKAIAEAYELLSDPESRAHYDEFGEAPASGPTMEDSARQHLITMFLNMAKSQSWRPARYVAAMRRTISDDIIQGNTALATTRNELRRMPKAAPKGPEEWNIFEAAINQQRQQAELAMEDARQKIAMLEAAMTMLEPYEDTVTDPQQSGPYITFNTINPGSPFGPGTGSQT